MMKCSIYQSCCNLCLIITAGSFRSQKVTRAELFIPGAKGPRQLGPFGWVTCNAALGGGVPQQPAAPLWTLAPPQTSCSRSSRSPPCSSCLDEGALRQESGKVMDGLSGADCQDSAAFYSPEKGRKENGPAGEAMASEPVPSFT